MTSVSVVSSPSPSADLERKSGFKSFTSWVHKYFQVYKSDNKLAKCDICNLDVKWGDSKWGDSKWGTSTRSLASHIKNKHRLVYNAAKEDHAKQLSDAAEAAAKLPKQTPLSAYFSASTKEMKDTAHLQFIIECGLPKGPALTVRTVPY
jgi:GTPase Era involved in 16S rRNA processing